VWVSEAQSPSSPLFFFVSFPFTKTHHCADCSTGSIVGTFVNGLPSGNAVRVMASGAKYSGGFIEGLHCNSVLESDRSLRCNVVLRSVLRTRQCDVLRRQPLRGGVGIWVEEPARAMGAYGL
jgi:hypothetical protein